MSLYPPTYRLFSRSVYSLLVMLALSVPSLAQNNIWNNAKDTKNSYKDKAANAKSGIKKWREHIENWGKEQNYTHHLALGGKLNSNGWTGNIHYLKRINPTQNHLWTLAFSEIKHEKQIKKQVANSAFPEYGESSPYIYGKINNLYTLQLGYGREQLLLPSVAEDNLSLSLRYQAGFSLAMLKPYYLKLVYVDQAAGSSEMREERYSDENAEQFLRSGYTLGHSKWSKGLNQLKPVPGAFVEIAAAIEVANSKILVQTITLGVNTAFYSAALPIMAELKAGNIQSSVFVGLVLGKKWKKRY